MKIKIIITFVLLAVASSVMAQNSSRIRRDQKRNKQQIEQAQRNVRQNAQAVETNLQNLELIEGQIDDIQLDMRKLYRTSDSLTRLIRPLNDSISMLNKRLDAMCKKYSDALRKSQTNASGLTDITFVFSSDNFKQAWQRYQSLKQFSRWRKRTSNEIVETRADLQKRSERLEKLRSANNRVLKRVKEQRDNLQRKRSETDRLVKSLRSQSKQLQQVLKRRQQEAQRLEDKLEKALAQELEERRRQEEQERKREQERQRELERQRQQQQQQQKQKSETPQPVKSEEVKTPDKPVVEPVQPETMTQINRRLTGTFESNKGKLPYPIAGNFTIVKKFGRQKHPRLPKVETNNPGIDVEAESGATVHAVFDGEVSQIFKLAGYNNVVVLRHGDYVTVYANIVSLSVKKGDKVSTGQSLGTLFVDKADGNRSVLHFELRHEKEKQNPELWLSR